MGLTWTLMDIMSYYKGFLSKFAATQSFLNCPFLIPLILRVLYSNFWARSINVDEVLHFQKMISSRNFSPQRVS